MCQKDMADRTDRATEVGSRDASASKKWGLIFFFAKLDTKGGGSEGFVSVDAKIFP